MVAKSKKGNKKFMKKSNIIKQKVGDLSVEAELATPKDYPNTAAAMSKVADAETRDDTLKRKGFDDYKLSLEKLLSAFDTFIREYSKRKYSAGNPDNFIFSDPSELTIYLLWQIRHTMVHRGGVIDENCKEKYEKKIKESKDNNITPIIDLPEELEVGDEFEINYDNYVIVQNCIFDYLRKRIPEEDVKILHKRITFTNIRFKGYAFLPIENEVYQLNIEEAKKAGCKIDYKNGKITYPSEPIYQPEDGTIIFIGNGESISAKKVKKEDIEEKNIFVKWYKKNKKKDLS